MLYQFSNGNPQYYKSVDVGQITYSDFSCKSLILTGPLFHSRCLQLSLLFKRDIVQLSRGPERSVFKGPG